MGWWPCLPVLFSFIVFLNFSICLLSPPYLFTCDRKWFWSMATMSHEDFCFNFIFIYLYFNFLLLLFAFNWNSFKFICFDKIISFFILLQIIFQNSMLIFLNFTMAKVGHHTGAKFEEYCSNISRDILDSVFYCVSETIMTSLLSSIAKYKNVNISKMKTDTCQKGKHHSSLSWKAFPITSNYFLLHRHCKEGHGLT